MTIEYGIVLTFAVGLLIAYFALVKKREFWLSTLYICVAVANAGYFLLSLAETLEFAILANDVVYLGSVFLSMCMLLTIVRLCGFSIKRHHVILCTVLGVLMFSIIATSGFLPWYYKSVSLETVNGHARLVKEYGPLHKVYLVYLLGYFAAMIGTILLSLRRKMAGSQKFAGLIAGVVCGNLLVWIFEKFISWEFEFLSVTYILSELFLLFIYWMMQDYVHVNDVPARGEEKHSVIFVDSRERAQRVEHILARLPKESTLSARQIDVLEGILDGKSRKEIAADLHLSENTVKMHTSALFKILNVKSREEIFSLLGS